MGHVRQLGWLLRQLLRCRGHLPDQIQTQNEWGQQRFHPWQGRLGRKSARFQECSQILLQIRQRGLCSVTIIKVRNRWKRFESQNSNLGEKFHSITKPLQKWDLLSVVASGRIRDRDSLPEVADPDEVHLWIPQILLKNSARQLKWISIPLECTHLLNGKQPTVKLEQ